MLHLGTHKVEHNVRFNKSAYYPVTFNEDRKHTQILFGASFGLWWKHDSVSVAQRPSDRNIDKIDLFGYTYERGHFVEDYAGSVDIEKDYNIILQFHTWSKTYKIKVYEMNELKPCLDFYAHYKYPWLRAGYTLKNKAGDKVDFYS